MRISVALATRDGATFVAEQVRSILAQTRPVDQLVVSDDASSDATPDVIREVLAAVARPPEVVLLRNPSPLGITANFEQALAHCDGGLIALSDQDDVWHSERIARQSARLEAAPELLLLAGNARSVDAAGRPLGYDHFTALEITTTEREAFRRGAPLAALLRRNIATGATMMMRRSLLERARPFPAAWLHDEWLAIIAAVIGRVELDDDCLIDYRQHGNNQVGMLKLTLADKIGRFLEPRTERNRRLRDRACSLADRLATMPGVDDDVIRIARDKARFEARRFALPASRLARIPAIARLVTSGDYARYGTGLRDAVRNLVQPV